MTPTEAAELGKRIFELWPTATSAQIGEATKGLLSQDYTYAATREALGAMYRNGLKFFEWGELRCRVVKFPPKVDPLTLPNSIESQSKRRGQERELMTRCRQHEADATAYVEKLPRDEVTREMESWLALMASTPAVREWYAAMLARDVLPMAFRLHVYEGQTGRRVA